MRADASVFLGAYPYRRVPGTSPRAVIAAMDRVGVDHAWATHLPGIFWRDPTEGNGWLYETCGAEPRLRAVAAVHPELPHWERVLREATERGAVAVRADPTYYGIDPAGGAMRALASACGDARLPLVLTVRLEDGRQRHPNDRAGELPPAAIRQLARVHPGLRLLVTHADRGIVDEVHFGLTPEEAARVSWDITWIWGPPEDHLETLLETVGAERFVFGTGAPLRLPENGVAKLDLLDLDDAAREDIEHRNLARLTAR
jgi:predicted TIM-barrel fold metal-dependent hydrolase